MREFPLRTGIADYVLYIEGRAAGVIEAKPEDFTLTGVETQSGKYSDGLPRNLPAHRLPLPFSYESTGAVTQFTNHLARRNGELSPQRAGIATAAPQPARPPAATCPPSPGSWP